MTTIDIELLSVSKQFGANRIVDDISLAIPKGKFVSILGPSGCGKTTTLNMIAGFEAPSSGQIRIRGRDQQGVPPEARKIGLVFQNYALFPHMTVAQNVGFGLRMQGRPREQIADGVSRALKSVHLEGFEDRYPKELSGGQQQRVAVARAIAPSPSVLLLDEPLSNLDLKLREAMRVELKEIQEDLGMTFIYVTHDQEEAMAMSDRIIVMHGGVVAQEGAPADIYGRPRTSFVADFIGKSNILPASAETGADRKLKVSLGAGKAVLTAEPAEDVDPDDVRFCCIRPEAVRLADAAGALDEPANRLTGTVQKVVNLGAYLEAWMLVDGGITLKSMIRSTRLEKLSPGCRVDLAIAHSAVQLLQQ
ncbi:MULTISPECIES: ABC transporter ATP-binding protein [unclassified Ensifer]|uniref:ABC transporter ATP-binding protein n=1 Tax=unclassified Ensifer TaxID=2633371 RepID=UPI000714E80B|nr:MULTISPECIES: ABC transporter ATP-binding protein [unclassified Ensifer]KQX27755.1 Fe3+/spermidine/putrescine ABC transporter ATP-binding protein [Ensifer sp. Root423]SDN47274.1 putative spermidine/putrescine transport system ATP-binding protein [Ensifer sp. YR511]